MSTGRWFVSRTLCTMAATVVLALSCLPATAGDDQLDHSVSAYSDNLNSSALLSNEQLILRADFLRDNGTDIPPAGGDYQWLSSSPGANAPIDGEKVMTRLLERRIKEYFYSTSTSRWLKQKLLPEQDGTNFIKDVNYDLKLRSDELVIGVVYEF